MMLSVPTLIAPPSPPPNSSTPVCPHHPISHPCATGSTEGPGSDVATLMTAPWRQMRRSVLKHNTVPQFSFRQVGEVGLRGEGEVGGRDWAWKLRLINLVRAECQGKVAAVQASSLSGCVCLAASWFRACPPACLPCAHSTSLPHNRGCCCAWGGPWMPRSVASAS